jgi:hypothetical protein
MTAYSSHKKEIENYTNKLQIAYKNIFRKTAVCLIIYGLKLLSIHLNSFIAVENVTYNNTLRFVMESEIRA